MTASPHGATAASAQPGATTVDSTAPRRPRASRYDPWLDLAMRWPTAVVRLRPMTGRVLGRTTVTPDGAIVIDLRADSSRVQLRSTLTHELVHLDRGLPPAAGDHSVIGNWSCNDREERAVEREAALRLLPLDLVRETLRQSRPEAGAAELADAAEVDVGTWLTRINSLDQGLRAELAELTDRARPGRW